jgi:hypothetical protein
VALPAAQRLGPAAQRRRPEGANPSSATQLTAELIRDHQSGRITIMLISRKTAEMMLDDAGIHGQDRERVLETYHAFHLGYLTRAIRHYGDQCLSTFMK